VGGRGDWSRGCIDGAHPEVVDGDWKFSLMGESEPRPLRVDELTERLN
jgi:hypothetical protein